MLRSHVQDNKVWGKENTNARLCVCVSAAFLTWMIPSYSLFLLFNVSPSFFIALQEVAKLMADKERPVQPSAGKRNAVPQSFLLLGLLCVALPDGYCAAEER